MRAAAGAWVGAGAPSLTWAYGVYGAGIAVKFR